MKTFVAVFEVPDDYAPAFKSTSNCDGWFMGDGELQRVQTPLTEVSSYTFSEVKKE